MANWFVEGRVCLLEALFFGNGFEEDPLWVCSFGEVEDGPLEALNFGNVDVESAGRGESTSAGVRSLGEVRGGGATS
jgi:hypothetical protein